MNYIQVKTLQHFDYILMACLRLGTPETTGYSSRSLPILIKIAIVVGYMFRQYPMLMVALHPMNSHRMASQLPLLCGAHAFSNKI